LAPAVLRPDLLPDPVPDRIKLMSPQQRGASPVLHSSWSSVFRVDVVAGSSPETRYLVAHDGIQGSIVRRFDGDLDDVRGLGDRALPFSVLPPSPRVLIIGAAGGHEILASLALGAGRVTGVELNPVTVGLLRDELADYSGRIAHHPKVELVNAEGRSFIERDATRYDLIWYVAPDSYSAMNAASSGAFVLSESYLYTAEMIVAALEHTTGGGVVCAQFGEVAFDTKPNRTTRYLATAREAFRRLGISAFGRHVLMSTAPGLFSHATILLSREPFTTEQVERFRAAAAAIPDARVWHAAGSRMPPGARHPVNRVISLPAEELASWQSRHPYDVSAVTDDSPFFWHFVRFRDALARPWGERGVIWDPEDATGERMLLTLLAFSALFAAVFLGLPLVLVRETWRRVPCKGRATVYFAALGLGFMFFEVCLIQKLTLFLGYPTYSLTVTLFALLVFSGLGSLLSTRYRRRNRTLLWLLAGIAALTLVYQFGIGPLAVRLAGTALAVRVAVAALLLAPLGLCLGAFMPLGLATVSSLSEHPREYVAWAWATNGFFSVVASVLATVLSMTFGFRAVLLLGFTIYAVGVAALAPVPAPVRAEPEELRG
jgi:spermidine synthase